jgi:hypothetical protein
MKKATVLTDIMVIGVIAVFARPRPYIKMDQNVCYIQFESSRTKRKDSFVENQKSFYLAKTHEDVSFIPEHNSRCIARLDCCIARSLGGMSAGDRYTYSVGGGGGGCAHFL